MGDSVYGSIEPMRSEAIPPRDSVERVSEIVDRVINSKIARGLTANQRAAIAWYGANGDRERLHTTRVFLKRSRMEGADPIICVYVDSHAFVTDLMANKDLYLARLANWGYAVSGIEFAVDREIRVSQVNALRESSQKAASSSVAGTVETLSEEQRAYVEELLSDVPESLRASISKAIIASMQDK